MLQNFGRALIQAIGGSSEVNGAARKISSEGYSLFLVLDGKEDEARLELTTAQDEPANAARPNAARPNAARPNAARPSAARPSAARPKFRLNSNDVEFLRSVGIDATRSVRRRRHAS